MSELGVALVLDNSYGLKLFALAEKMPVWIITSPENDPVVEYIQNNIAQQSVTTLLKKYHEPEEYVFLRAIYAIDEHHGPDTKEHPYDALYIYGAQDMDLDALAELGFICCQKIEGGIRFKKNDNDKNALTI